MVIFRFIISSYSLYFLFSASMALDDPIPRGVPVPDSFAFNIILFLHDILRFANLKRIFFSTKIAFPIAYIHFTVSLPSVYMYCQSTM